MCGFHYPDDHVADTAARLEKVLAFLSAAIGARRTIEVMDDETLDGLAVILGACGQSVHYIYETSTAASRAA